MCYHTRQIRTVKDLELKYGVRLSNPSYRDLFNHPTYHLNGFSHPNMLIIPQHKPSVLAPGIWGIVPSSKKAEDIRPYYKESIRYGSGLNAKSEKLFDHFIYKHVAFSQRCIIPVTGFFEPFTHLSKKYPIYIHRRDDELLSLAGIYTIIDRHVTFSILTKAANPYFEGIHNIKKRQPVILNEEGEKQWLNEDLLKSDIEQILASDVDVELLEAYPVSKDIYKSKIESNRPDITDVMHYPELDSIAF